LADRLAGAEHSEHAEHWEHAELDRPGNVLAALALVIADQMADATAAAAGRSESAPAALSPTERGQLDKIVGKMLIGMMRGPGAVRWICRLCDTGICRGSPGGRPVGNAALARYRGTS
jgi:hypothetical protein